ncbi:hypothetical protein ACWEDZ_00060 [Streptomyces sp. NPDC005047]
MIDTDSELAPNARQGPGCRKSDLPLGGTIFQYLKETFGSISELDKVGDIAPNEPVAGINSARDGRRGD